MNNKKLLAAFMLLAGITQASSLGRLSSALNKEKTAYFDSVDRQKIANKNKLTANDLYELEEIDLESNKLPIVGQESTYEGYEKLRDPFTQTDEYNFVDAFFGGLKLEDFYEYSDDCLNSFIFMVDDIYYFDNNVTLVERNATESGFHMYLNLTHLIGGKASEIPPRCYQFMNSVYQVEESRWEAFEKDWGEFFLAFLFNLMGNALNFQQRFANIAEFEENQDYVGVYREAGYIVHLIYNFTPLPEAFLNDIHKTLQQLMQGNEEYLDSLLPEDLIKVLEGDSQGNEFKEGVINAVTTSTFGLAAASMIDQGKQVHQTLASKIESDLKPLGQNVLKTAFPYSEEEWQQKQSRKEQQKKSVRKQNIRDGKLPIVGALFDGWGMPANTEPVQDTFQALYGFVSGVVGVFDDDTLPTYCYDNITEAYWAINRNFILQGYNLEYQDQLETFMDNVQIILQMPYFVSFNCYYAGNQIFVAADPWADGELTEIERLRTSIILVNDLISNLVFNVGYMYGDVVAFSELTPLTEDWWIEFGEAIGDFVIRIFWRKDFLTTFVY